MHLKYDMKIVFYKTYKIKSFSRKELHITERKIYFTQGCNNVINFLHICCINFLLYVSYTLIGYSEFHIVLQVKEQVLY